MSIDPCVLASLRSPQSQNIAAIKITMVPTVPPKRSVENSENRIFGLDLHTRGEPAGRLVRPPHCCNAMMQKVDRIDR